MERALTRAVVTAFAAGATLLAAATTFAAPAGNARGASAEHARIVAHWTPERRAAAIPRDFVLDERGHAYLRKPDGSLQPYGHSVAAARPGRADSRMAKPGGDTTAPDDLADTIRRMAPRSAPRTRSRRPCTDASGMRSVSFRDRPRRADQQQSFNATNREMTSTANALRVHQRQLDLDRRREGQGQQHGDRARRIHSEHRRGGGGGGGVVTNAHLDRGRRGAGRGRPHLFRDAEQSRKGRAGQATSAPAPSSPTAARDGP